MAVNKVVLGNETLIDLTGDTVTANTLLSGVTAHSASGAQITGSYIAPLYLKRIYISTPPTKTSYTIGETLDLTGMVVKGVWSDDSETIITNSVTTNPANGDTLSASDTSVDVTYEWSGAESSYTTMQNLVIQYPSNAIFGVEWDGTSSGMQRTDDAIDMPDPIPAVNTGTGSSPFDNIMPWSGMVRVTNPYSISDYEAVAIPKYYYKWSKDGTNLKLQISMQEFTGSHVSPAHADRGDGVGERSIVYVGRYLSDSNGKSTNAQSEVTARTRSGWRSLKRDFSTATLLLWDYQIFCTIQMLYLVEFASWNFKSKIGSAGGSARRGITDSMIYHTGASTYGATTVAQYRNIENLCYSVMDGLKASNTVSPFVVYGWMNPSAYGSSSGTTRLFESPSSSYEYNVKSFDVCSITGFEYVLIPSTTGSPSYTYTTYGCNGTELFLGIMDSNGRCYNYFDGTSETSTEARSMILPK